MSTINPKKNNKNDRDENFYQKRTMWTIKHIVSPAFKYWCEKHGGTMKSLAEFSDQLFTKESKVQVLATSYLSFGPKPMKEFQMDIGYIDNNRIQFVLQIKFVFVVMPMPKM